MMRTIKLVAVGMLLVASVLPASAQDFYAPDADRRPRMQSRAEGGIDRRFESTHDLPLQAQRPRLGRGL